MIRHDDQGGLVQNLRLHVVVIAGPCSIHDPLAAVDYAERVSAIAKRLNDEIGRPLRRGVTWFRSSFATLLPAKCAQ